MKPASKSMNLKPTLKTEGGGCAKPSITDSKYIHIGNNMTVQTLKVSLKQKTNPTKKTDKCQHKWKTTVEDDLYRYVECESCGRKSKQGRTGKANTYVEPNPEKKQEINSWIPTQKFIPGKAVILDAKGLKTAHQLHGKYKASDIIIPEYDTDTYEENAQHETFGECMRNGMFLDVLKSVNLGEVSLIYADFMGRFSNFVEPLLKYLKENDRKVRSGVIIGFTWSDNGAGTKTERSKIIKRLGRFEATFGYSEFEETVDEIGYGKGGCMNVQFLQKD